MNTDIYQRASIVIANYNNGHILPLILTALNMQACKKDLFEVIVSDDGSSDNSKEVVESFETPYELKFITRIHDRSGRSAVRNAGIKLARYPIIILLDSDSIPMYDFIISHISLLSYFNDIKNIVIGFRKFVAKDLINEETIKKYELAPHNFSDIKHNFSKATGTKDWRLEPILEENPSIPQDEGYVVSSNISFFKKITEIAGMFSEEFKTYGCEDTEFGFRLLSAGCKLIMGSSWVFHIEHDIDADQKEQLNESEKILKKLTRK